MMLDNSDNSSETTLETFNALIEHGYPPPNPIRSTHTLRDSKTEILISLRLECGFKKKSGKLITKAKVESRFIHFDRFSTTHTLTKPREVIGLLQELINGTMSGVNGESVPKVIISHSKGTEDVELPPCSKDELLAFAGVLEHLKEKIEGLVLFKEALTEYKLTKLEM